MAGGAVPDSSPHGPLATGDYAFQAVSSGDANYNGSTSLCEPFSVGKADTTTTTDLTPAELHSLCTSVCDIVTETSTNTSFVIGGTVTYRFYSTGDCSGFFFNDTATTEIYPLPLHDALPIFATGDYAFQAVSSGDANYNGSTSLCEPFSVGKADTTTATRSEARRVGKEGRSRWAPYH